MTYIEIDTQNYRLERGAASGHAGRCGERFSVCDPAPGRTLPRPSGPPAKWQQIGGAEPRRTRALVGGHLGRECRRSFNKT